MSSTKDGADVNLPTERNTTASPPVTTNASTTINASTFSSPTTLSHLADDHQAEFLNSKLYSFEMWFQVAFERHFKSVCSKVDILIFSCGHATL